MSNAVAVLARFTGFAFVAFIAFLALFAVGSVLSVPADNLSKVYGFAVCICDNKLAGFIYCRLSNAVAVLARFTGFAFFALITLIAFCAVCTLYIAKVKSGSVSKGYVKLAVIYSDIFNTYAVLSGRAGFAFITLVALFTLCSYDSSEICNCIVGIGYNKLAKAVDFGFLYTDSVIALITLVAFFALFAFIALGTGGTYNASDIGALSVGEGNNKLAFGIYLCGSYAYAVFAFFSLFALFAFVTLCASRADNIAEVGGFSVRICDHKLAFCVNLGIGNTDSVCAVFSVVALVALCAVGAVFTYYIAQICALPVGICNNKLAVFVYFGFCYAYSVCTV